MRRLVFASLLAMSASGASAGLFDGQTLRFEYHFPQLGTLYVESATVPPHGNYVVGPAVEILDFASAIGSLDLQSDGFTATFVRSGTFGNGGGTATYNGIVISDILGALPAFSSLSVVSNTAVTGGPLVSFDADNLYINWVGMPFQNGSVVFAVTAIPEPSSFALLFAGLGLLGFVAKRRAH